MGIRGTSSRSRIASQRGKLRQGGAILLETLVGIAVISTTVLAGLVALSTASVASQQVQEDTRGAVVVVSQIELIRTLPYVATGGTYASVTPPAGYTVQNSTAAYPGGNPNIQNVTVQVLSGGQLVKEQTVVKINR